MSNSDFTLARVCNTCNLEKSLGDFSASKLKSGKVRTFYRCKDCDKKYLSNYYMKNRGVEAKENMALRELKRQEKLTAKLLKKLEVENKLKKIALEKGKIIGSEREYLNKKARDYRAKLRETNPDMVRKKNRERAKKLRDSSPAAAMRDRVRRLISISISKKGYKKASRTNEILGCDYEFFKRHIEMQFTRGMTWDNRKEWEIDHITPVSLAKTEGDVVALNHFTNLRPLWKAENRAKRDVVTHLV